MKYLILVLLLIFSCSNPYEANSYDMGGEAISESNISAYVYELTFATFNNEDLNAIAIIPVKFTNQVVTNITTVSNAMIYYSQTNTRVYFGYSNQGMNVGRGTCTNIIQWTNYGMGREYIWVIPRY